MPGGRGARFVKDEFHCIRVTPQIFTIVEEIDRICDVMEKIARAPRRA